MLTYLFIIFTWSLTKFQKTVVTIPEGTKVGEVVFDSPITGVIRRCTDGLKINWNDDGMPDEPICMKGAGKFEKDFSYKDLNITTTWYCSEGDFSNTGSFATSGSSVTTASSVTSVTILMATVQHVLITVMILVNFI